ncbi:MAG TPA: TetR/AcrR family transcriptional regulator [Caulobacteraceae bacterium]|jgi:AcrR family transcriptional regulator|nr:TetR/AcrR family transcriptional regulator [Caulobacteraceae bacterium]
MDSKPRTPDDAAPVGPPPRKRQARSRARLAQILDQSLECFAEQGFERATYDDLIRRSKVSRGSFYWYFPSKEALYDAVLDYCVDGYVDRVEAAFATTDPDDHIVKRLLGACLTDFQANRSRYRVLLRPPPSPGALAKLAKWNDDALGFMRGKLEPLVAAGRLDAATAALLPDVLSAFLDGICVRAVLEVDGAVPALGRNIETFLCRIVPEG